MKNKSLWIFFALFCVFFIYSFINNHLGKIYSLTADYYLKNNNINKAQFYYEKSFQLGIQDLAKREAYVNSIINSPFTIESQKKLFNFINNSNNDSACQKAKNFLYEIKEEIHNKYPNNFINNAVYNQKIIRWSNMPITYSFVNKENIPSYFVKEFENAFTEWENATDRLILFQEGGEESNILIEFDENHPSDSESQKFVVAYASPILSQDYLKNMEIVFYLKNPNGEYFDNIQVYNTALHEIAHVLGFMGHSQSKNDVMYFLKDSKSEINTRDNLSESDINTIKLLYKIKPHITNSLDIKSEFLPELILDSQEEVNNEKIKEAKIYIKKVPNLPTGYIDLAEGYVIANDYKKAIKSLKKALNFAEDEDVLAIIYYNLAVANLYAGSLQKAESYLKESMLIKNSEEKHYLLAEIYMKKGDLIKASKIYQNLLKENPNNIEYLISLTNIYIVNKNFIKARNLLKEFVLNNPIEKNNPRFKSYGIIMLGL